MADIVAKKNDRAANGACAVSGLSRRSIDL